MPYIQYEKWNPSDNSIEIVTRARAITEEYAADGYDLTLRQLYYQFVARGWIANTQRSYKNLGSVINKARMAGLVDWSHIVDRTRNLMQLPSWADAGEIISSAAAGFKLDRWEEQDFRVEVWIEKDALTGVISGICNELDVPYFSCRGYPSQSELWRAARRQQVYEREGKEAIIIHLGDHDPSGMDMTRDIEDRLWGFGATVEVRRVALNWDQVTKYQPPPNPAKLSDSRARKYIEQFGYESWELDALEPGIMRALIETEVTAYRDDEVHDQVLEAERSIIDDLWVLSSMPWEDVEAFVQSAREVL